LDIWLVFFPPGCVVVSLDSDAICASSAKPGKKILRQLAQFIS
jgi:hypothetical protein